MCVFSVHCGLFGSDLNTLYGLPHLWVSFIFHNSSSNMSPLVKKFVSIYSKSTIIVKILRTSRLSWKYIE